MHSPTKYRTFLKRYLAYLIDSFIFLPFPLLANFYERSNNTTAFYMLTILHLLVLTLYVVIGHGRYGQTIGKYLVGIKVLATNEKDTIGYRGAFLREGIWLGAQIVGIVFLVTGNVIEAEPMAVHETLFKTGIGFINTAWFLVEMITMLLNKKRRALQDLVGGSVVVDWNELKREQLDRKIQAAMPSFQEP